VGVCPEASPGIYERHGRRCPRRGSETARCGGCAKPWLVVIPYTDENGKRRQYRPSFATLTEARKYEASYTAQADLAQVLR
jgi:Arm DNA-binding domain